MNLRTFWTELKRRNKVLAYAGLAYLWLFAALTAAALIDPTEILGINRWIKPMKFAISIAIFLWTMGWLMGHLKTAPGKVKWISLGLTATMIAEIVPIAGQATRRTTSHFNNATGFDAAIFSFMGIMIVANSLFVLYALYLFFTTPVEISPAYLWGIRLGLLIFLLASAEGGVMVAMLRHSIGAPDGGPGLPFTNWSTKAGDLRIAHFVGLHALQALPISGYFLDRLKQRGATFNPAATVIIISAAYLALTTGAFIWAMFGRPLIAFN